MNEREISTDFIDIISDYRKGSQMYIEAKESVNKGDAKSTQQLKNFLKSITKVDNKSKDPRITSTKGNFQKFKSADIVKEAFEMLGKNDVKDLKVIYDALIKYAPQYEESYAKGSRIIQLEYESAVYILVTGLSAKMTQITDIKDGKLTTNQVKFTYIEDMTKKMSAILSASNHKEYLDSLLSIATDHIIKDNLNESAEEMYFEASFGDVANLINTGIAAGKSAVNLGVKAFNTVKNTVFGIVPLIRGITYLKYNRKADTINALEDQIVYIKDNIEQLKNRTNMDSKEKAEIIKKQEAVIEKYKKKAAKLRAQLLDGEAEAAREIKKDDPNMKKTTPSDEMVLEGVDLGVLFEESSDNTLEEDQLNEGESENFNYGNIDENLYSLMENTSIKKDVKKIYKKIIDLAKEVKKEINSVSDDIRKEFNKSTTVRIHLWKLNTYVHAERGTERDADVSFFGFKFRKMLPNLIKENNVYLWGSITFETSKRMPNDERYRLRSIAWKYIKDIYKKLDESGKIIMDEQNFMKASYFGKESKSKNDKNGYLNEYYTTTTWINTFYFPVQINTEWLTKDIDITIFDENGDENSKDSEDKTTVSKNEDNDK